MLDLVESNIPDIEKLKEPEFSKPKELMGPVGRREYKYVIDDSQRTEMEAELGKRMKLKPDGNGGEDTFPVVTLYYDSPDYDVYRKHELSHPSRRKLSVRVYGKGEHARSFLNIKQTEKGVITHRRAELPVDVAMTICQGEAPPPTLSESDMRVVQEAQSMVREDNLQPSIVVRSDRRVYKPKKSDPDTQGVKVTFVNNIRYRTNDLIPRADDAAFESTMLQPDDSVMEIQIAGNAVPTWLSSQTTAQKCVMQPFSKYSNAVGEAVFGIKPLISLPNATNVTYTPLATAA